MELPRWDRTGVYKIVNLVNGKPYVGSTATSFRGRAYEHRKLLRKGRHPNIHLQRAWNKYGEEAFEFRVVQFCPPEDCLKNEQRWIDRLDAFKSGYNRSPTAGSTYGLKWSEQARANLRAGHWANREDAAEIVERSAAKHRGKKHTEEHKAKIGASHWKNRPDADEVRSKVAAACRGQKRSPETCARIRVARMGKRLSPEVKRERLRKMRANALARKLAKLAQTQSAEATLQS